jgi:predicted pyridoxine 5'-phosphate oxidase superfamily flavin-nucleotide-binding protein
MASYRVQVIAMATGVAAGVAAAQAARQGLEPRDVLVTEIQEIVFQAKV